VGTVSTLGVADEATNRAAKLQNHTKAEQVGALATQATLERAVAQGYAPDRAQRMLAQRRVAGIDEPLDLVAIG
jgi:class 3 adenylate cyclase